MAEACPIVEGSEPAFPVDQSVLKKLRLALNRYLDAGLKVILVYGVPEAGWDVPKYIFKSLVFGNEREEVFQIGENGAFTLSSDQRAHIKYDGPTSAAMDGLSHPSLFRVRPMEFLCDSFVKGRCVYAYQGQLFYRDDDHLNNQGAALLVPEIMARLRSARNP